MLRIAAPFKLLVDVLMPRGCAGCDATLGPADGAWCAACAALILRSQSVAACPRCGKDAGPYLASVEGCPECRGQPWPLDGMARAGPYAGVVGDAVKRLKFARRQDLDEVLGEMITIKIQMQPWGGQIDALVPVPTDFWSRVCYQGHPAGLLARAVSRRLRVPVLPLVTLLHKPRRQTGLPESQRARNVHGAFRIARRARVAGRRLCVVDDVCTSGATLREIARVLKAAGAVAVYGAVAARTQRVAES